MCGIVGYVGERQAAPILIGGLRRLEYRGYDSSGVAVKNGGPTTVVRALGKLAELVKRLERSSLHGNVGIGHTRWATHGQPSELNAHPHTVGSVALVHNGIVENHAELRQRLLRDGRIFSSETDTEILAHLVDEALHAGATDLPEAVRMALRQVDGAYAVAVMSDRHGDGVVGARKGSPLVVGVGDGEGFLASDVSALVEQTREVIFLDDGELVELRADGPRLSHLDGQKVVRAARTVDWTVAQAEKNGYPHFMLKEINEQPRAVADTLAGRLRGGEVDLDGYTVDVTKIRRVVLLACGTSYHAAMVGKFMIEEFSRLHCEVDLASEFRYRNPIVGPEDFIVAISQSGETADTLAAIKEARTRGAQTFAISNVVQSAIPRAAHAALYTHAGIEIAVASTKAFTTQLAALTLLALHLGRQSGKLDASQASLLAGALAEIPDKMTEALAGLGDLSGLAARYAQVPDVLFMGRGSNHAIALEGALKLKEIAYIHAEGFAAGEMKHGPIALIAPGVPVVVIAPSGPGYDKVLSNLAEVRARAGRIIAVATHGDRSIEALSDAVLWLPPTLPLLQPLLTVLPLQLFAYASALARGNDVDQPRNLAKSVTVE